MTSYADAPAKFAPVMETDPVIVTEDDPAVQVGASRLNISCAASRAYASIKLFFCGQIWPMTSRRVAVREE